MTFITYVCHSRIKETSFVLVCENGKHILRILRKRTPTVSCFSRTQKIDFVKFFEIETRIAETLISKVKLLFAVCLNFFYFDN